MADENYGMEREPREWGAGGPVRSYKRGTGTSPGDEKTWSMLAHLSIFLNIFTGFMGPVAALIIYLVYRGRSPRVSFHALQSLWYQVAWMGILFVGWTVTHILMALLIGFALLPVMLLLTFVPLVHAAHTAYRVSKGVDYRYPWVADLVDGNRGLSS